MTDKWDSMRIEPSNSNSSLDWESMDHSGTGLSCMGLEDPRPDRFALHQLGRLQDKTSGMDSKRIILTVGPGVVVATVTWLQYRQQFSNMKLVAQKANPPWDWKRASHWAAPRGLDEQKPENMWNSVWWIIAFTNNTLYHIIYALWYIEPKWISVIDKLWLFQWTNHIPQIDFLYA